MDLPPVAREVLDGAAVASLVTLNADGSPQATVAWVGLEPNPPPGFVIRIAGERIGASDRGRRATERRRD